jgi:hypothetical protein
MVSQDGVVFHKPDDRIPGETRTWRDLVLEQKECDLVSAYRLYSPPISPDIYKDFYGKFKNRFYIFSAGWGIIRANFKLPDYNITYSTAPNMPEYARRRDNIGWNDINHLKEDSVKFNRDSVIILFVGSDSVPPFCGMTKSIPYEKKILYNGEKGRKVTETMRGQGFVQRFDYEEYQTDQKTNWHYKAAREFIINPGEVAGI